MIIKTYVVGDMYEAMVLIKQELGGDAVIVGKREVRQKGIFGMFKKKKIEVTAALENNGVNISGKGIVKKSDAKPETFYQEGAGDVVSLPAEEKEMKEDVKQIKNMLNKMMEQTEDLDGLKNLEELKAKMMDMDIHKSVIEEFESYAKEFAYEPEMLNSDILKDFINEKFQETVKTDDINGRIKIFIGPTGVGKTTTIAKLASKEALLNHKEVGLITIDTYRIGAVEQLKIYANILDIPIKVVFSPEDLPVAIEQFKNKDLIFIDSTGRNHRNVHQLNEVKTYFDQCNDMKTFLVLSMVTKNVDLVKTVENYQKIGYDSIILTKFDETYSYGNILNAAYYGKKPISYLCKGQVVPDDIEPAEKDVLLNYLWGGEVK